uniref:Uncharacterized protein n=1 Tax=Rhizophora mucronata TaxID=61149 RepID=A0A2P2QTK8_RHIMU
MQLCLHKRQKLFHNCLPIILPGQLTVPKCNCFVLVYNGHFYFPFIFAW